VRKRKFDFREGRKEILLDRLVYVESKLHVLEVHVMENDLKVYTMNETLNTFETRLAENDFVRIHQSFLVNVRYITDVARYKVILTNGSELPVPRARYAEVRNRYIACQGEV
jgi:DNA-binding LytR/AlgR family response regulator